MSLRDALAGVLARDSRYTIQAYGFVFESLEYTKHLRKRARVKAGGKRKRTPEISNHVSGRELCQGARDLALRQFGFLAMTVLSQWGVRSTSDIGNIVYNLIASGDLEKTPHDSRADFDNVFDFEEALRRGYILALDDVA